MKTTSSLALAALSVLLSAASRFPSASAEEDYAQLSTEGFDDLSMSMPAEVGKEFARVGFPPNQIALPGFAIDPSVQAGARTCLGICLNRVTEADCPRDAPPIIPGRLPFCYAQTVSVGEFCDAAGECGTSTARSTAGLEENCNVGGPGNAKTKVNRDVYRRVNCRLGGTSNGGGGSGNCAGVCLVPLETTNPNIACPNRPEDLPGCATTTQIGDIGTLCEGDGRCGTDQDLNNCGDFDVYRRYPCVPPLVV